MSRRGCRHVFHQALVSGCERNTVAVVVPGALINAVRFVFAAEAEPPIRTLPAVERGRLKVKVTPLG